MPTHAPTVSISILAPETGSDGKASTPLSDDERTWTPWASMSSKFSADEASPLKRYESSPSRWRYFCGVCGSPIGYEVDPTSLPAELNWPHVVLLWTGALDRSVLENDWVRPDHIMFTSFGIPVGRNTLKACEDWTLTFHLVGSRAGQERCPRCSRAPIRSRRPANGQGIY